VTDIAPAIEVFADIWCPFTHMGLRMVAAQRDRSTRPDTVVVVRAWPLELVNGAPMDAEKTRANAAALRAQVAPDLFAGLDADHFPTSTLEALALVVRAYRTDPRLGERMSFAVRDALFEQGADISDHVVLAGIAELLGVPLPDDTDRATVRADWEDGRRRGVVGSPHFFAAGTDMFCPSLQITKDPVTGLAVHADATRLQQFLAQVIPAAQS
jgi:predicted DsbA family dithiol-disulfide isomerase